MSLRQTEWTVGALIVVLGAGCRNPPAERASAEHGPPADMPAKDRGGDQANSVKRRLSTRSRSRAESS